MIQTALSTFHRLDALVNNAGVQRIALPLDVSEEHWDLVGDGADAAAIVSFLVGPDSRYMTGQALNADGGILTY
jgi:NAD(P)-dependent dehydrogenase (short-subunit alcohol dehydrogenase family)